MTSFTPEVVALLLGIAAAAVLGVLSTLASLVRNATAVHDLAVAATTLRNNYERQMARIESGGVIEVGEVEEGSGPG